MARTTIATDGFTGGSAGDPVGSNWTEVYATTNVALKDGAGHVYGQYAGADDTTRSATRWSGAGTFTDDQYSSLQLSTLDFLALQYGHGVIVRASGNEGTRQYYQLSVAEDGSGTYTTTLSKVVGGTYTSLHSAAVAWSIGDLLELEVEGSTVRAMKNGVALGGSFTVTDTSIATGGTPGIAVSGGATVLSDNWEGGNLTTGAVITPTAGALVAAGNTPTQGAGISPGTA